MYVEYLTVLKQSLYRWVKRYEELEEIERLNRKPISYKISKEQVKYTIEKLKENEQITMEELHIGIYLSHFKSSRV
jgi:hypothetical protein